MFWMGAILAIGLAGFLLCSAAWSVNPQTTITEGVFYLFVVLGAIGISEILRSDEYMDLLALLSFLAAVATLL